MRYRITFLDSVGKNNDGIILTADEINYVRVYSSQDSKETFANRNSIVQLKISGKLISNLDLENSAINEELGFNNSYDKNLEITGGIDKLSKEYQARYKELHSKLSDNMSKSNNKFYLVNRQNIKKLSEFAFGYKKENDYRDIIIEVDLGSGEIYTMLFKQMYAEKFKQLFSIDEGTSTFIIDLKQKYYEENKIEIFY